VSARVTDGKVREWAVIRDVWAGASGAPDPSIFEQFRNAAATVMPAIFDELIAERARHTDLLNWINEQVSLGGYQVVRMSGMREGVGDE